MHTTITFEVRWTVDSPFAVRSFRKVFPNPDAAKAFKHAKAERYPDRRYTVVKITVEEVA